MLYSLINASKMRIPSCINPNCFIQYRPPTTQIAKLPEGNLKSFQFGKWDTKIPKTLQEQCIQCISRHWLEHPVLSEIILPEDKYLLLDILPVTVPLELSVPLVEEEVYWKRCYLSRWPQSLPIISDSECENQFDHHIVKKDGVNGNNGTTSKKVIKSTQNQHKRTWKKRFCELHLKHYLESLKPEDYNPEQIKSACDLFGSYVEHLKLDEMKASENSSNKIPLHAVITGFPHLTELSLRFKQNCANEDFSWNLVNTSLQDVILFAKGLEKTKLKKLSITDSDIDCEKLIIILKSLLDNPVLEVLDFSKCKIGDTGTVGLSKFILENAVQEINLNNNRIGGKGICCLAYAISQTTCNLTKLHLNLNQIHTEAGNILIDALARHNTTVRWLSLAACGLTGDFKIAEALLTSKFLEEVDLSNNALGQECGLKILQSMKTNSTVRRLDLRMCKISSEIEAAIQMEVVKNRKNISKENGNSIELQIDDLYWTEDLITEVENALMFHHSYDECDDDVEEEEEEESVGVVEETLKAEFSLLVP